MNHKEILKTLLEEVATASETSRLATETFQSVIKDIPSSIPHPDGVQRIHNVSAEYALARKNLKNARLRLEQFQAYGFVPNDLK